MSSFYDKKNILVTGGGGLIGSHLVEALVEEGANVRVAQRSKYNENLNKVNRHIELINVDLLLVENCLKAVRDMEIVFDLAAMVGNTTDNKIHPGMLFYNNTRMSSNMLEAASVENVERYMCSSSNSVYSPNVKIPNIESDGFKGDPDESNIGYGWAKRFAELGAVFYSKEYGIKVAIARTSNTYGPRDSFTSDKKNVVSGLIQKVFSGNEKIEVWGSGNQKRSFIYVKDVIRAMMKLTKNYAVADPVNIGVDSEISVKELVTHIVELSGKKLVISFNNKKQERISRRISDTSKIKEKLKWGPSFTLHEGLKETIDWYCKKFRKM